MQYNLKKYVIIICITIIAVTGLTIACIHARENRIKDQQVMKAENIKRTGRIAALNASSATEVSRIATLNFYQKLKEGDKLSILIVGDDIGQSDGSTQKNGWSDQLVNKLNSTYKSTFEIDKMTQSGSTIVRSWIEYCRQTTVKKYDAVFICDGQNDQNATDSKDFYMCYDNLIWHLIQNNPSVAIFPIIESSIKSDNAYTINMNEIADYYGLDVMDTRQAFSESGKSTTDLTNKDNVHPNDTGYGIYASEIYNIIANNMKNNKSISYKQKTMSYSASNDLNTFNFNNTPKSVKGFTSDSKLFTSSNVGDSISFDTKGSINRIYYNTDPYGSKFKIYLNEYLVDTIDTTSYQVINSCYLMPSDETGTITIVVSSVNANAKVSIGGLVTNK